MPEVITECMCGQLPALDETDAPMCPHGHGQMVPRSLVGMSREAMWCGTWYDCPPGPPAYHCASSVLVPSAELQAALAGQGAELIDRARRELERGEEAERQAWADGRPANWRAIKREVAALQDAYAAACDAYDATPRGCEACNAEPGEECRPMCIGEAAHDDELGDAVESARQIAAQYGGANPAMLEAQLAEHSRRAAADLTEGEARRAYVAGQVIEYTSFDQSGYSVGQVVSYAPDTDQDNPADLLVQIRARSGGRPFTVRARQLRDRKPQ